MVKLPIYDNERSIQTGSEFMRRVDADQSVARGLNELASGLNRMAAAQYQLKDQGERLRAEAAMLDFERTAQQTVLQAQENMPEDGVGFHDSTMTALSAEARKIVDSLPADKRAEYELRMYAKMNNLSEQAAKQELGKRQSYLRDITTNKMDFIAKSVEEGFTTHEEALKEIDTFVAATGMAPEQAKTIRQTMIRAADSAFLQNLIRTNPEQAQKEIEKFRLDGAAEHATPVQRTIIDGARRYNVDPLFMLSVAKLESNFNPRTTASKTIAGIFQMTAATRRLYGIPEEAKFDPALATAAFARLTQDNTRKLTANNIPVDRANLWGMHFLGAGGFLAFARANPGADAYSLYASVAGPRIAQLAFSSNGFLLQRGDTVGNVLNKIRNFYGSREREVQKMGLLNSTVAGNTIKEGEIQIGGRTLTGLRGSDLITIQSKLGEEIRKATDQRIAAATKKTAVDDGDPDGVFNKFDTGHMKALNDGAKDDMESVARGDDAILARYRAFGAKNGVLPKPVADGAEALITSRDETLRAKGFELLSSVSANDPSRGLDLSGVPDKTRNRVETYTALRSVYAMTELEAVRALAESEDPQFKSERRVGKEQTRFNNDRARIRLSGIQGQLAGGSDSTPQAARAQERLMERVDERYMFYRNSEMDHRTALARAVQDVNRSHNVSGVTGRRTLMLYPPEQVYPKVDGSHDYIGKQLLEHVNSALKDRADREKTPFKPLTLKDVEIAGTTDTAREVLTRSRDPESVVWPKYEVFYRDPKTGRWEFMPGRWSANPNFKGAVPPAAAAPIGNQTQAQPKASNRSRDFIGEARAREQARQLEISAGGSMSPDGAGFSE